MNPRDFVVDQVCTHAGGAVSEELVGWWADWLLEQAEPRCEVPMSLPSQRHPLVAPEPLAGADEEQAGSKPAVEA